MFQRITSFMLLVCSAIQLHAVSPSEIEVTQGFRHDKMKSTIKDDYLGLRTDRRFKDIFIYQSRIAGTLTHDDWFAKARLGYGDIFHGKERAELDFFTVAPMKGSVKSGYTLDAWLEFGKRFALSNTISLSPSFGYMWEKERLHVKGSKNHGFHVKDTFRWNAPFVGVAGAMQATSRIDISLAYKFLFAVREHNNMHWKDVGTATYNSKRSEGFGNMGTLGIGYRFADHWKLGCAYELSNIHTKGGKFHGKAETGHHIKTTKTSSEFRLALDYLF